MLRAGMEKLVILGFPSTRVFQVQERSDVVNASWPQGLHGFPFWMGINLGWTTPPEALGHRPAGGKVPGAARARGHARAVGRAKQRGGAGGLLSAPRLLQKVSGHQRHQLGSQSQDGQWEGAEPGAHMWDLCTAWFVGRSVPGLWTMW